MTFLVYVVWQKMKKLPKLQISSKNYKQRSYKSFLSLRIQIGCYDIFVFSSQATDRAAINVGPRLAQIIWHDHCIYGLQWGHFVHLTTGLGSSVSSVAEIQRWWVLKSKIFALWWPGSISFDFLKWWSMGPQKLATIIGHKYSIFKPSKKLKVLF